MMMYDTKSKKKSLSKKQKQNENNLKDETQFLAILQHSTCISHLVFGKVNIQEKVCKIITSGIMSN